ncbi:MAG: winged helix-turn-helix domain-containing protein [Nanoarchaeota archaeon]
MKNSKITKDVLYQFFILKILVESGGEAETYRVIDKIKRDYGKILTEEDLKAYEKSKEERCSNYIRFARQHLIEAGCLKKGSPRGFWEITDQGKKQYAEWSDFLKANLPQK